MTHDTTPPTAFITSGPAAGSTTSSTRATFSFAASEASDYECWLDDAELEPCEPTVTYGDLDAGTHTEHVRAIDGAGNTSPIVSRTWTVDPAATSSERTASGTTPPAGGTVSTDPSNSGPTAAAPVTAAVTTPSGGDVTISESPADPTAPPTGFSALGHDIQITAPDASLAAPLRLTFVLDGSLLPSDTSTVTVLRNGSAALDCLGANSVADAAHDPCVTSRTLLPGGDLQLTILSSHASRWNLAQRTGGASTGGGDTAGTAP